MSFNSKGSSSRKRPDDPFDFETQVEKGEISPAKQEQRARNVLLHQLARSSKSTHQLRLILEKREIQTDVAEAVLTRFTEVGLIDDLEFARTLVSSRRKIGGKSASVIRRELAQKGISSEIADSVLSDITHEDECALALSLAERRIRQLERFEPEVRRRRLMGYLLRKGFNSSAVSQAVRQAEASL
jgi:regulatory protein